jgi:uncharacterized membrane protein YbaN (DUF454 family)
LLAKGTKKGRSAAQETPMKPTNRDASWLVVSMILAVSGAVSLYRLPSAWWQVLIIAAILVALSPFLWERNKR